MLPIRVSYGLAESAGSTTRASYILRFTEKRIVLMALSITTGAPTLFIRRAAYEASGLSRNDLDARLGLTSEEFRVEGDLVAIGPIYGADVGDLIADLERVGLVYFDDFFELTGNWPEWLGVHASAR